MRAFKIISWLLSLFIIVIICVPPITKLRTQDALQSIEENYVRQDLNAAERKNLDFCKYWILANEKAANLSKTYCQIGAFVLFVIAAINNIVVLKNRSREAAGSRDFQPVNARDDQGRS